MKKIFVIIAIVVGVVLIAVLGLTVWSLFSHVDYGDPLITFYPEESYFMDYTIEGNVIKIKYSVCFENHRDYDQVISVAATFDSKKGFDYHNYYHLYPENGKTLFFKISALEKNNYVLVVEKEFSGDELDIDFSPPTYVSYVYATEDALE